jgi:hypothetical protein
VFAEFDGVVVGFPLVECGVWVAPSLDGADVDVEELGELSG